MRQAAMLWKTGLILAALPLTVHAISREQIDALFQPFLAEKVALAPDGAHVAYTEHARGELNLIIMALEPPYTKVKVIVADDVDVMFSKEKKRATLRFLRWSTANRLVFAPTEEVLLANKKYSSPLQAIDADGKNPKLLLDGADLMGTVVKPPKPAVEGEFNDGDTEDRPRSSRIIGFPAGDRGHLLVQVLGAEIRLVNPESGRTGGPIPASLATPFILPTTLFSVDVITGKKKSLGDEFIVGGVGYDRQGGTRISWAQQQLSVERPFALLGKTPLTFNESWLGPLAQHFTISPKNYFDERAYPLGFDVNPDVLYIASNVGRDTFGVYALNLKTRQRTDLALELPHFDLTPLEPTYPDTPLIFDEHRGELAGVRRAGRPRPVAVWRDPEIAATQQALERKFPQRTVEILEWSDARDAFLVRVSGGTDPGRYFVWRKKENLPLEIFRSAPWLKAAELHPTEFFEFDSPAGVHLTGYMTTPLASRLNPPPAIIYFADGIPAVAHAEFDREAQVLAAMGFVVLRLNHRGVEGFGRQHREAILEGIDRIPVEDAVATLDWIGKRQRIDRRRVVAMGAGFGG